MVKQTKIARCGPWMLAPLIGAAVVLAFLFIRDRGGESFAPPAAVGEQDLPGAPVAPGKIQEARDFKDWPLWWLGESFDSLNLTYVGERTPRRGFPTINMVAFVYGECTPPPGGEGCGPPLQIQISPLCWNPPERFGIPLDHVVDFRGAKAFWEEGATVRIWTGDSAILIGASPERLQKAADGMVPLGNVQVTMTDSKLPAPNFGSCPETPIYPVSTPVPYPPAPTPVNPTGGS
jgi:hypothetical protein